MILFFYQFCSELVYHGYTNIYIYRTLESGDSTKVHFLPLTIPIGLRPSLITNGAGCHVWVAGERSSLNPWSLVAKDPWLKNLGDLVYQSASLHCIRIRAIPRGFSKLNTKLRKVNNFCPFTMCYSVWVLRLRLYTPIPCKWGGI